MIFHWHLNLNQANPIIALMHFFFFLSKKKKIWPCRGGKVGQSVKLEPGLTVQRPPDVLGYRHGSSFYSPHSFYYVYIIHIRFNFLNMNTSLLMLLKELLQSVISKELCYNIYQVTANVLLKSQFSVRNSLTFGS